MEASQKLKEIRKEIAKAKKDGNQKLMFKKLADFQQFHIDQNFTFGGNEIYRYPKILEKLGYEDEAVEQRKVVHNALLRNNKRLKQARIKQVKHSGFFRFKSMESNSDLQCGCTELDGMIGKVANIKSYKSWMNCSAEHCTVSIHGESEQSLKRKGIELPL